MQTQLIKAVRMHAKGELERAKTNVLVYMHNPAGIGEHSDVVEAIQAELDKMAIATDRLDMIEEIEYEVDYDDYVDDEFVMIKGPFPDE
jgi:YbbR domain-containing protein